MSALIERLMRFLPTSIESTFAVTTSFARSALSTVGMRSWLISEMCTRPSMPGASSMNAPNGMILVTRPVTVAPASTACMAATPGSVMSCFMPRPIFAGVCVRSSLTIFTVTTWPTFTTSAGLFTRSCDRSDTWMRPSTPPMSANAP